MTILPTLQQRFIVPDLPNADDLLPYLRQIDANKWYTNFGPLMAAFEQRFAAAMAAAHGATLGQSIPIGVASGYQALTVGLRLSDIGPADKVLVPSVTFPACPLSVSHLGGEPVLSDVDPDTWTLTPAIARAVAAKTKLAAVMPVCVYGLPLPAEEWDAFTRDTGVKVVIDAAAAVENQRYLKNGIVAHSLHALKPFGIGEGGIVVSPSGEQAERVRQSINFGMTGRITYQTGENAKMSEYHAAVALAQLDRWEGIKARRKGVMKAYIHALKAHPVAERIILQPLLEEIVPSSLMLNLKSPNAAQVCDKLCARGVAAHRTYLPPLFDHPYFASLRTIDAQGNEVTGTARAQMKGAKAMQDHVLGLPFHPFLTEGEIDQIVNEFAACLNETD